MALEQPHHKIEQPAFHGDRMAPSAAHEEAHRALLAPENRNQKRPKNDPESLVMSDPHQKPDAKNHAGFPGADIHTPTMKDPALGLNKFPTTGVPLSDTQFQPISRPISQEVQKPARRDEEIAKEVMGTAGAPISDTQFQLISHPKKK